MFNILRIGLLCHSVYIYANDKCQLEAWLLKLTIYFPGAFWYNNCFESNFFGRYYAEGVTPSVLDGISFANGNFINGMESLKAVKLRLTHG